MAANYQESRNNFCNSVTRAAVWESGIGHAVATIVTGSFIQTPFHPPCGQPSGDGVLSFGCSHLRCEIKAEDRYPSANLCFETKGARGRDSGLTLASGQVDVWLHYHGQSDTLIAVKPRVLLAYLEKHRGKSGIRFVHGMGDGKRASGYLAPIATVTGVPGVRTFTCFSGTYLTGKSTLHL